MIVENEKSKESKHRQIDVCLVWWDYIMYYIKFYLKKLAWKYTIREQNSSKPIPHSNIWTCYPPNSCKRSRDKQRCRLRFKYHDKSLSFLQGSLHETGGRERLQPTFLVVNGQARGYCITGQSIKKSSYIQDFVFRIPW